MWARRLRMIAQGTACVCVGGAAFEVGTTRSKAAFVLLAANNPCYADVEWREYAAGAWAGDDVEVDSTREADTGSSHVPPATPTCFARWMEHAQSESVAGDFGYAI